jgi:hypothetical protein
MAMLLTIAVGEVYQDQQEKAEDGKWIEHFRRF